MKQNKFLKNNSILFMGGLFTGAVNYALYPIISRFITVEQFGEVQILMSLIAQLAIAGAVIRIFVVNVVKEKDDDIVIASFLRNTSRTLLVVSTGLAVLFLLISPLLRDALQFESIWPLVPTAVGVILGFLFMIPVAHLQAKQLFSKVSLLQFAQALTKLILAAILGYVGFGTAGVVWGVVLSGLVMQYWARLESQRELAVHQSDMTKPRFVWGSLKKELRYITLITASMGSVTFLLSLDTFFVKYYFTPEDAGLYAGIAVVARTLFFLTASVAGVMISSVKIQNTIKTNIRAYTGSVVLMTAASAVALVIIVLTPDTIVRVLIGADYTQYSDLLPKLAVAMYGVGLINIITNYHVAMRESWIVIPTLGGLSLTALLIRGSVETLTTAADAFLTGVAVTVVMCFAWTVWWNYHQVYDQKTKH